MLPTSVTIAICTYKRDVLLKKCLDALVPQIKDIEHTTILVIDNASSCSCEDLCRSYKIRYQAEEKIGVSFARNKALQEANSSWVFFLDDDGIPQPNLLKKFLEIISDKSIKVIGGKYCHYFASTPPKWLELYYKKCHQAISSTTLTLVPPHYYLSIGIMAFQMSVFEKVNSFNESLGMRGEKFGYGEEDEIQDRIRAAGIPIYFSPDLSMDHLVSERKYTIKSRVQMAYAHGLAWSRLAGNDGYTSFNFIRDVFSITFYTVPYDIARFLFKSGFYWQNSIVSTFTKYANAWGKLKASR